MFVPDILVYSIFALASLIIIIFSAGYIISAISDYAHKTGISDYLIGSLVVAVGTSLPEITTALMASFTSVEVYTNGVLKTSNAIILGDIIGANIIDVAIVLGAMAIVGAFMGRKIVVHGKVLDKTLFSVLIITSLPLLFGLDGKIDKIEGIALILAFLAHVFNMLRKEGKFGHLKKDVALKDISKDMFILSGCLISLLLSAYWLLHSSEKIGYILDLDPYFMGLVLISFGTTVPELSVNVKSVIKGTMGIAFGDILGSVVCNSTLVLGVGALINPIIFSAGSFIPSALFMMSTVYIAILFIKKKQISWEEGIGLFLLYATFISIQLFMGMG